MIGLHFRYYILDWQLYICHLNFVTFIIIRETPGYKLPLALAPYCFITRALVFCRLWCAKHFHEFFDNSFH